MIGHRGWHIFHWFAASLGKLHFVATVGLVAAILPAFKAAGIPLRFAWAQYFEVYWLAFGVESLFLALLLYSVTFPLEALDWLNQDRREPGDLPSQVENLKKAVASTVLPSAYLFVSLILIMSYNDVIATFRFDGSWDFKLNQADKLLLSGYTVSAISTRVLAHSPAWIVPLMQVIYAALFPAVGCCIILIGLRCGHKRSMQFVGAIVTAYYLGLIIFFFVPATGPYILRPHSTPLPDLTIYSAQAGFIEKLAIVHNRHLTFVGIDYYVALPCLHITQPIIILWFVRKWRPIRLIFSAFSILLIPSILLLEEHYVVDLIGGIFIAILAIAMVDGMRLFIIPGETVKEGLHHNHSEPGCMSQERI
jgi:hypothetical protein